MGNELEASGPVRLPRMSTMISTSTERRLSSSSGSRSFSNKPMGAPLPSLSGHTSSSEGERLGRSSGRRPSPHKYPLLDGTPPGDGSQLGNEKEPTWAGREGNEVVPRHGRQKSLSDAFKTIRTRRASVSANAHEIADALKAPVSVKLIVWAAFEHDQKTGLTADTVCRYYVSYGTCRRP